MQYKRVRRLSVCYAKNDAQIKQAQRLRYQVFASELGACGIGLDHMKQLDIDSYDDVCEHLLLIDCDRDEHDQVVGSYRLLQHEPSLDRFSFYSDGEYDLSCLKASNKRLLELGRSCIHPDYRGGMGMPLLWRAIAQYIQEHQIDVLFGTASFSGVDVAAYAPQLALLQAQYLAPKALRPSAKVYQKMDLCCIEGIDSKDILRKMPPLIRSYLRLGGRVGDGAFIDQDFNTIDVCMIVETQNISARHWQTYGVLREEKNEFDLAS